MEKYITKPSQKYININCYPVKVNVIDPTRDNFTQPLSIKNILDELNISKDDHNRVLAISKVEDLELLWKDNAIPILLIITVDFQFSEPVRIPISRLFEAFFILRQFSLTNSRKYPPVMWTSSYLKLYVFKVIFYSIWQKTLHCLKPQKTNRKSNFIYTKKAVSTI